MNYPKGSRVSIRSIKLEINDAIAFSPLNIEVEYDIHCQLDTVITSQNVETGELVQRTVPKTKTLAKGKLTLPLDKFNRLNIDVPIDELEDINTVWECMHKIKYITEKLILSSSPDKSLFDDDAQQIIIDLDKFKEFNNG